MSRQCFTDLVSKTSHQIEDAWREICLINNLRQDERIERCDLTWLQDHGAPRCERRGNLERYLIERNVPRCDGAYDTDGLFHYERITYFLRPVVSSQSLNRVGELGDGVPHLYPFGETSWCSHLVDDDLNELARPCD